MRWILVAIAAAPLLACGQPPVEASSLRAFGNEPFWNVSIRVGDSIVYGRMGETEIPFPYEAPDFADGDSAFVYGPILDGTGRHTIEIRISRQDCQDTMADVIHPMRAWVTLDGEELSGCARDAEADARG